MNLINVSIVDYYGDQINENCGYCKQRKNVHLTGLWGHIISPHHYEILMNRGWRRCGNFYYKPNIARSCCAQYTIRSDITEFTLRKSHKKVLRRMRRFLISGSPQNADTDPPPASSMENETACHFVEQCMRGKRLCLSTYSNPLQSKLSQPPGRQNQPKDLLFHLDDSLPPTCAHKLSVVVVRSCPPCADFTKTFDQSYNLYKKYQMRVHHDTEGDCTIDKYRAFLCTSALVTDTGPGNVEFGSFHMQYWLDESLLAVGVIDILPSSLSSKYFFYDPDYSFLSLGTYSILREIAYLTQLSSICPQLRYYYMGFYIHTCPKMKYKCTVNGSYLLCPTTYNWCPFEECLPLITRDCNCCRFLDKEPQEDPRDLLTHVKFVFRNRLVNYRHYLRMRRVNELEDEEISEIRDFAANVDSSCLENMYLFRPDFT